MIHKLVGTELATIAETEAIVTIPFCPRLKIMKRLTGLFTFALSPFLIKMMTPSAYYVAAAEKLAEANQTFTSQRIPRSGNSQVALLMPPRQ